MLQQNPVKRPTTEKMLKSSLFKNKMKELGIPCEDDINTTLLKTIRVPKKIIYLTDRLPKPNYDFSKSTDGLLDNKKFLTEASQEVRERTSTLPRL